MDKLQLPHAKLFYYSAQLFANGLITEHEKLKLKEMVINDEPEVFEVLERYLRSQNLEILKLNLFALLRPHQKHLYQTNEVEAQQIQNEQQQQQQQQVSQPQEQQQQPVQQQQQEQTYQNSQQIDIAQNGSFGAQLNGNSNGNAQLNSLVPQISNQSNGKSGQNDIDYQDKDYTDGLQARAEWINQNPNVPDEISSPLGLQLLKRKKRQIKKKHQQSELKPYKVDDKIEMNSK